MLVTLVVLSVIALAACIPAASLEHLRVLLPGS